MQFSPTTHVVVVCKPLLGRSWRLGLYCRCFELQRMKGAVLRWMVGVGKVVGGGSW